MVFGSFKKHQKNFLKILLYVDGLEINESNYPIQQIRIYEPI